MDISIIQPLLITLQRGSTQLSIIQPHFMPLLITLQRGSTQLSIIQTCFMPLLSSLQRGSTQLSIIQTCFMLITFTLRESPSYPPIAIWFTPLFIKIYSTALTLYYFAIPNSV
jgi:hypothetical protein